MFFINPHLQAQSFDIGDSKHKLWVVDDFIANFQSLLDYSNKTAFFNPVGYDKTLFPGIRDNMPVPYFTALAQLLDYLSKQPRGQRFQQHNILKCWLSKVTLRPEELDLRQTIPHFDSL